MSPLYTVGGGVCLKAIMTNEQRKRAESLCREIAVERDQRIFIQLVRELNDLLEASERAPNGLSPAPRISRNGDGSEFNPYATFAGNPRIAEFLTSMIYATGADFGNVQLFDSTQSGLRIVEHHGFGAEFLSYFGSVCCGNFACGAAMNQQRRVTITDILTDPLFQDIQTRDVMLRARVRACQSTPLVDPLGNFIGVVSTHFQQPTAFDPAIWQRVEPIVTAFTKGLSSGHSASGVVSS